MSFCPICKSEYIDCVTTCSECKTTLIPKLEDEEFEELDNQKIIEIYKLNDEIEASLIKDLLIENRIDCNFRDMHITPYPVSIGQSGEIRITVLENDSERAKELIQKAIEDNYISDNGEFIKKD